MKIIIEEVRKQLMQHLKKINNPGGILLLEFLWKSFKKSEGVLRFFFEKKTNPNFFEKIF